MDFHGLVCRVEFDKDVPLVLAVRRHLVAGRRGRTPTASRSAAPMARITEPNLPNGLVLAGWDGEGEGRVAIAGLAGQQAEFAASSGRRLLSRRGRAGA